MRNVYNRTCGRDWLGLGNGNRISRWSRCIAEPNDFSNTRVEVGLLSNFGGVAICGNAPVADAAITEKLRVSFTDGRRFTDALGFEVAVVAR